jgi:hypothetical protein
MWSLVHEQVLVADSFLVKAGTSEPLWHTRLTCIAWSVLQADGKEKWIECQ